MKALVSLIILISFSFDSMLPDDLKTTKSTTGTFDPCLLDDSVWAMQDISTAGIPADEKYDMLRDEILNLPNCSKDDYLAFNLDQKSLQFIRNESCSPDENKIDTYPIAINGNDFVVGDENVNISFEILESTPDKLVIAYPLEYIVNPIYYVVTYCQAYK